MMSEEQWSRLRQQPVEHAIMQLLSHMLLDLQKYPQNSPSWNSITVTFRDYEISVRSRNLPSPFGETGR